MSQYLKANTPYTEQLVSNSGGTTLISADRSKDATHAMFYYYEPGGVWADDHEFSPVGFYEIEGERIRGEGYTKAFGPAQHAAFYGFDPGLGNFPEVVAGTTAAFPGDQAPILMAFEQFDRVGFYAQARSGTPENAMWAVVYLKESVNGFTRAFTDQIDYVHANTMTGLQASNRRGLGTMVVAAEGTDTVDVSILLRDENGDAVSDSGGSTCLVSLVLDGAGMAPASAWTLTQNDGGATTVAPVGTPGLGLYLVTFSGSGAAQLRITDVATGSAQVINITATLNGVVVGNIDAATQEAAGVATFTT